MSDSFVNIATCFSGNQSDRTISDLSALYDNADLLENTIASIVNFSELWGGNHITDKRVLIKPNWVRDNRKETDKICLCTHEHFILAALNVILKLSLKSILIADAPIQGCKWEKLLSDEFLNGVEELSNKHKTPILIKDFRRVKYTTSGTRITNAQDENNYIIFDVGNKSYLEEITTSDNRFRVTRYNPDRLAESHHKGMHKYCIAKDVFECDTIITMPKIKTHQKAGLTNSLKILVGINGEKDYLPHHRIGAAGHGGDCYKGYSVLRSLAEHILDSANRRIGNKLDIPLLHLSSLLWKMSGASPAQNSEAGWYGNDTVLRMVLDLNLISIYGKSDGAIPDVPQRKLFTLCDGIIGGQGNGPLNPEPLALGIVGFSNDAYAMDEVAGILMGMEIEKVPLLKIAMQINKEKSINYTVNSNKCTIAEYKKYAASAKMAPGWIEYNKK